MALDAYDNLVLDEDYIFAYYPNDESSGTTAADAVGTKPLTLASGTTSPSTAWGARLSPDILPAFGADHQAFDFNGTNGHATSATATSGQPPLGTPMAIEAWVRMDSSQSTSPTIFGNAAMIVQQYNGRFYGKIGSGAAFGNYSRTIGTVYHIMLAWTAAASGTTSWKFFINGSLAGSGTVSVTSSTPNYTTMGGHFNGTLPFDGVVSRFAVYSGASLYTNADSMAASHYDAGVNGISSGPETHSGTTLLDGSGTVSMTSAGYKGATGTTLLDGSSTVAATSVGYKSTSGTTLLTGSVTLTSTGNKNVSVETHSGTTLLSASVGITSVGSKTGKGTALLSSSVTLTSTGFSNQIAPVAVGYTRFQATNPNLATLSWSGGTYTVKAGVVDVPTSLRFMIAENWVLAGILRLAT